MNDKVADARVSTDCLEMSSFPNNLIILEA